MKRLIKHIPTNKSHKMDLLLPVPRFIGDDSDYFVDISDQVRKGHTGHSAWDIYALGFIRGYEPFLALNQFWFESKTQEDYLLYE